MTNTKVKREIVKFVANEPVQIVLETEPSEAKANTRETQWGPKTSYTYFTGDGRVAFPTEALHDKLKNYSMGDTVIITLVEGNGRKLWQVTSDSAGSKKEAGLQRVVENTETTILLRTIAMDVMQIKAHLLGTPDETTKPTNDEDSIDF